MHFYVDESGNTGSHLFDENQPTLYYGILSSKANLDVVAARKIRTLRKRLSVERLHASELGNTGLINICTEILSLQKKYDIRFDFFSLAKADHAIISFFDQTFDQGINKAVPYTAYWTPLRYMILVKLSSLFDEPLLRKAWKARITRNSMVAE